MTNLTPDVLQVQALTQISALIVAFVGVMAFLVSVITEVLKKLEWVDRMPTALVVILLSLIVCPVGVLALAACFKVPVDGFVLFASFIAAFFVALVAMDGWERVTELAKKFIRK